MLTAGDIRQLAGLFEGEGSFMLDKGRSAKISIASTDRDVMDWVSGLIHLPVHGPYSNTKGFTPKAKPLYVINSTGAVAAGLMMTLYPFMGIRRKEKIHSVLTEWRKYTPTLHSINRTWGGWNGRSL